ncbi:hypothetical protein K493DRAFT_385309 [Basidiobolus meristosporus CBS 931.73]|uniref:Uncharacterized protein n=1 Tax=Basidiobolus meristosporus CBS 931.73 TaxID=1314790 RepID=A0A1Y1XRK6_9FUNG|nr:hypothetical protein K493DRAFT_385309 [Basidiobolus meristosporus CBS 931.73]|eukprot:ORX88391.1 hypothetical protein K493DRAFT_385309 [Basidiobolus meristosporus CBS 931.73]
MSKSFLANRHKTDIPLSLPENMLGHIGQHVVTEKRRRNNTIPVVRASGKKNKADRVKAAKPNVSKKAEIVAESDIKTNLVKTGDIDSDHADTTGENVDSRDSPVISQPSHSKNKLRDESTRASEQASPKAPSLPAYIESENSNHSEPEGGLSELKPNNELAENAQQCEHENGGSSQLTESISKTHKNKKNSYSVKASGSTKNLLAAPRKRKTLRNIGNPQQGNCPGVHQERSIGKLPSLNSEVVDNMKTFKISARSKDTRQPSSFTTVLKNRTSIPDEDTDLLDENRTVHRPLKIKKGDTGCIPGSSEDDDSLAHELKKLPFSASKEPSVESADYEASRAGSDSPQSSEMEESKRISSYTAGAKKLVSLRKSDSRPTLSSKLQNSILNPTLRKPVSISRNDVATAEAARSILSSQGKSALSKSLTIKKSSIKSSLGSQLLKTKPSLKPSAQFSLSYKSSALRSLQRQDEGDTCNLREEAIDGADGANSIVDDDDASLRDESTPSSLIDTADTSLIEANNKTTTLLSESEMIECSEHVEKSSKSSVVISDSNDLHSNPDNGQPNDTAEVQSAYLNIVEAAYSEGAAIEGVESASPHLVLITPVTADELGQVASSAAAGQTVSQLKGDSSRMEDTPGEKKRRAPRKKTSMMDLQDTLNQRRMSVNVPKSLVRKLDHKSETQQCTGSGEQPPQETETNETSPADSDISVEPEKISEEQTLGTEASEVVVPEQSKAPPAATRSLRSSSRLRSNAQTKPQNGIAQQAAPKKDTPKNPAKGRRSPKTKPAPLSEPENDPAMQVITIEASDENPLERKPPVTLECPLSEVKASSLRTATKDLTQYNSGYHLATLEFIPIQMGVPRPPSPTKKLLDRINQKQKFTAPSDDFRPNADSIEGHERKRVNWDPLLVSNGTKKYSPSKVASNPTKGSCMSATKRKYSQPMQHEVVKIQRMIWLDDEDDS